jgi:predicted kinase
MKNKQHLIITVGYPGSGKSTLVRKIRDQFPTLNIINGDPFRDFLRDQISYFHDVEYSKMTPKVKQANSIAKEYKRLVFETLLQNGASMLIEGNHLERDLRDHWFIKAKEINPEIVTTIIYCAIQENELLMRYARREKDNPESSWISEFREWNKARLDEPTPNEADKFIIFNQHNEDEVIKLLGI